MMPSDCFELFVVALMTRLEGYCGGSRVLWCFWPGNNQFFGRHYEHQYQIQIQYLISNLLYFDLSSVKNNMNINTIQSFWDHTSPGYAINSRSTRPRQNVPSMGKKMIHTLIITGMTSVLPIMDTTTVIMKSMLLQNLKRQVMHAVGVIPMR